MTDMLCTYVIRQQALTPATIKNSHRQPADATSYQSLEQGGTFAGWKSALTTIAPCIFTDSAKVLLIIVPFDIASMGIGQEGVPFLFRQARHRSPDPVHLPSSPIPTINKRAGVTRILQNIAGSISGQLTPHQSAMTGLAGGAHGKFQSLLPERAGCGYYRACAAKSCKQQANALLDLFVRIQNHLPLVIVDKAHR